MDSKFQIQSKLIIFSEKTLRNSQERHPEFVEIKIVGEFDRPVMGEILSLLAESNETGGVLTLKLVNSGIAPDSKEGYLLTIQNGNVEIASSGEGGFFTAIRL